MAVLKEIAMKMKTGTLGLLVTCVSVAFASSGCAQVSSATMEQVRSAAAKAVPAAAKVEVTAEPRAFAKPSIVISAHLLEGASADDYSPYVRGDYAAHEKLLRLVKLRCARVYDAVLQSGAAIEEASCLVIRVRHGVRQYYGSWAGPSSNVAQTIFQVSLPMHRAKAIPENGDVESMEQSWTVEMNLIPQLRFETGPAWFGPPGP